MVGNDVTSQVRVGRHHARRVGRVGYAAYGLIHLAVAWLALQVAFGGSSNSADSSGALAEVAQLPWGRTLLLIITSGMALLTLWKFSQVILGVPGNTGRRQTMLRAAAGAQVLALGVLTVSSAKFTLGHGSSAATKESSATARMLDDDGGRMVVALAGLIVLGIGIGMAGYGLLRKFEDSLSLGKVPGKTRHLVRLLGAIGYLAKGVAFGISGGLLVAAAVTADAEKSRGLDAALRTLAGQPYGKLLLTMVASGIACFGAFCFVRARYSRR